MDGISDARVEGDFLVVTTRLRLSQRVLFDPQTLKPASLTPREAEILDMIYKGLCNKEIAVGLNLEVRTVKFHIGNLYAKLGVHNRGELFRLSQKDGEATVK